MNPDNGKLEPLQAKEVGQQKQKTLEALRMDSANLRRMRETCVAEDAKQKQRALRFP